MRAHRVPCSSSRVATTLTSSQVAGRVVSATTFVLNDGLHGPAEAIGLHLFVRLVDEDPFGDAGSMLQERCEGSARGSRRRFADRRPLASPNDAQEDFAGDRILFHSVKKLARRSGKVTWRCAKRVAGPSEVVDCAALRSRTRRCQDGLRGSPGHRGAPRGKPFALERPGDFCLGQNRFALRRNLPSLVWSLRAGFTSRSKLVLEKPALRPQLATFAGACLPACPATAPARCAEDHRPKGFQRRWVVETWNARSPGPHKPVARWVVCAQRIEGVLRVQVFRYDPGRAHRLDEGG